MLRKITLVFIICLGLTVATKYAVAATAEDARQFVDNLGKSVINVLNDSNKNDSQKKSQLQQMFLQNVDITWMGQFVLGVDWKQATDDQRKRYMDVYKKYMVAHYTTNFSDYTGSKYNITDVKKEEEGKFVVGMKIKTATQSEDISAGYSVRGDKGSFKIVDIIVEGVSLVVTQRSEFGSVVHQKGMDGLISSIESKINTESSSAKPSK